MKVEVIDEDHVKIDNIFYVRFKSEGCHDCCFDAGVEACNSLECLGKEFEYIWKKEEIVYDFDLKKIKLAGGVDCKNFHEADSFLKFMYENGYRGCEFMSPEFINRPMRFCIDNVYDILWSCTLRGTSILDVLKNNTEKIENKMKYKTTNYILSSKNIKSHNPCRGEFNKFVRRYGWDEEIVWIKEVEDYMLKQDEWIEFLLKHDFIKENKIDFDENKIYLCKMNDNSIYKLHKNEVGRYTWLTLNDIHPTEYYSFISIEKCINYVMSYGYNVYFEDTFHDAYKKFTDDSE